MAQPKACQDWNPSSYPAVQCWASLSIILSFLVCGAGTDPMSTWVEGTQPASRPVAAHLYYGGGTLFYFFNSRIPSLVFSVQGC